MDKEFNDYSIKNPDGVSKDSYNSQKIVIDNESPGFIKETSCQNLDESVKVDETFNDPKPLKKAENVSPDIRIDDSYDIGISSEILDTSTSLVSTAQTATTAATVSTTIGGSVGALASVVASSMTAAVLLVAAFVSTLTISLKLVMASINSLTVEVVMSGAQEEDFEDPIIAVLTSSDGTHQEIELDIDSHYIVFGDLTPNQEYIVTIRNSEKIFDSKSYITKSEQLEKASIIAWSDASRVFIMIENAILVNKEYYTVIAKDSNGKEIFAKDDRQEFAQYELIVEKETTLYITLSIDGVVYDYCEVEIKFDQSYDLNSGVWEWNDDYTIAQITFKDLNGGVDLVVTAEITSEEFDATCTSDAYTIYHATAIYEGNSFFDEQIKVIENSALDHIYGELITEIVATCDASGVKAHYECSECGKYFDEEFNEVEYNDLIIPKLTHDFGELIELEEADCENDGLKAHYVCSHCGKYFDENYNEVSYNSLVISALGHDYGELIPEVAADYDNNGMKAHYVCSRCGKYFDENKVETTYDALVIPALGHELGELIPEISPDCEKAGFAAHYVCSDCGKYFDINKVETTYDALVIPALGHDYGELIAEVKAGCEEEGMAAHYICGKCGKYFDINKYETTPEELIIAPTGHEYGEPEFEWIENEDGFYVYVIVRFTCVNDANHYEEFEVEPQVDEIPPTCETDAELFYTVSIEFEGEEYYDEKYKIIEESAHGHEYEPVFDWVTDNDGFYIAATLRLVCVYDSSHVIEVEAEVNSEEYDPTCEEDGYIRFYATAIYQDEIYEDQQDYILYETALGHEYVGEPEFVWEQLGEEEAKATAVFTCSRDPEHKLEIEAQVEINGEIYVATVMYEQEEYVDTHPMTFEP